MTIKSERVAELIMTHLSQLLMTEVRDPRLQGITIIEVDLDREIEHAQIWVTSLDGDESEEEVMTALEKASGFLRRELASRLRLRRMPQLHFKWDYSVKHAMHMEAVLDELDIDDDGNDAPDDEDVDDE
jgi:ribosome-binding factor A